ncbi:MAG: hypothetical protein EHM34_08830 [Nitrosopumilales archaeon]|nr:MAG: hypothetical protein EHM34_08830 [Nitrosopumilales archaeon]
MPIGAYICHKCDNPKCVNPDHIYAGTPQTNADDMVARNRTRHFVADNPTKYYGIRYDKSRSNWISYVYVNKKKIDIGRHISEVDAARNHDRIIYMKFGKKERFNFPEEYDLK